MFLLPRDDRDSIPWYLRGNLSAIEPPPGVTSNFIDPPSKAHWDVVTQAVCLTVATLLVAMRMYTKFGILRNAGWDDYTCFLAWLGLIAMAVLCLEEDRHGNGRHSWDITGYQYTAYAKLNYIVQIIYNPIIFFTKVSILVLYLRVFKPVHRTFIALHVVLWTNLVFYAMGILVEIFQCRPIAKAWLPLMDGHCINQAVGQSASAAINTLSDYILLILPIAAIWQLKMYAKGKIGLAVIFGFGLIACICSTIRLAQFAELWYHGFYYDSTWHYYSLNLISIAEITCGLICGCLTALPAFLRHISGIRIKIMITSSRNGGAKSKSGSSLPTDAVRSPQIYMTNPAKYMGSPTYSATAHSHDRDRRDKGGVRHGWEELHDLQYVAGDEMQMATEVEAGKGRAMSPR